MASIRALYMYSKKGDEGEHYLLAKGRNRQADLSAVVVIDGEQRRTPTARNCNDVRCACLPTCPCFPFAACLDALPATLPTACHLPVIFVYYVRIGTRQAAASFRGDRFARRNIRRA